MAQERVQALEEGIERSLHIHTWRFIEGGNPEHYQLIKMHQTLKQNLIVHTSVIDRLKNKINKLQNSVNVQDSVCARNFYQDVSQETEFLEDVLREKQRQIQKITDQLNSQQVRVEDRKESVYALRSIVKESKIEVSNFRKKFGSFKLSRQTKSRSFVRDEQDNIPKFIGGGFSVGGFIKDSRSNPLRKTVSQVLSPGIVFPKPRTAPTGSSRNFKKQPRKAP
jgi:polyhydroxyalkanoate synthesis regulator phasin